MEFPTFDVTLFFFHENTSTYKINKNGKNKTSPLAKDMGKRNFALICTSFANVLTKTSSFAG